jgi:hypothetical protein
MRRFFTCRRTLGTLAVLGVLSGCGAGDGTGLDPNGRPIDEGTVPPPTGPTLASIQANVFTPSCAVAGCHGGAAAQRGLRLDPGYSAASLINVSSPVDSSLVRVVPGQPDASFLVQKLEGTQTLGDRMPQGGPYLPQSLVDDIRLWIANGANP